MISREISNLEKNYNKITYKHIPRIKNSRADYLANKALDIHVGAKAKKWPYESWFYHRCGTKFAIN